ncbi:hypothetical protein QBC38DRAFT_214248 [Podospora fimiseda]|uniref:Secreted protein n=1 Tax=Podospora fimiseda TaxID=252190 RepID=A0AAN7BP42_9PEZI|nr:hypothetical protein QBC38DRAFT_214248 [Podospora fimiseda]
MHVSSFLNIFILVHRITNTLATVGAEGRMEMALQRRACLLPSINKADSRDPRPTDGTWLTSSGQADVSIQFGALALRLHEASAGQTLFGTNREWWRFSTRCRGRLSVESLKSPAICNSKLRHSGPMHALNPSPTPIQIAGNAVNPHDVAAASYRCKCYRVRSTNLQDMASFSKIPRPTWWSSVACRQAHCDQGRIPARHGFL